MKKIFLTLIAVALLTATQAQNEIKIFDSIIPKVTVEPPSMDKATVLAIFDTLKYYTSVNSFIENNSGLYPPSDVRKVFKRLFEIVNKDLTPFMEGRAVKVEGSVDNTDPENPIVIETIYWPNTTAEDKTAWRVAWRALDFNKNHKVPLDIWPVWSAHRLYN